MKIHSMHSIFSPFSPLRSLWNLCLCRFVQWLLAKNQKQKWLQFLMFQPVLIRESRKGEEGLKMEWYGMNFHWESGIWKKKSLYFPPGRIKHYFGKFIIRITCPSFSAQFHTFGRGENLSARVGMSWPSLSIGSTFSFLPSKWNVISKPFQFFYDLIYFHLIYISLAICIKLIWLLLVLMEVGEHIGILYDDFHFASSSTFGKDVWPWIWSCSCSLKQRSARNNNYKTVF